ncbi:hypothetical protein [Tropicibacter naphthalenivorans]|uniref:Putative anti-sigmaE protein n=1 Tax=Tropicibacter naphthalenivorans TaxID=441103 RepID=A0A0P1G2X2_9RHOB|nr:hypothetical protein [Tropicibacter naphthalenivorans]CUH76148.1 putative anti-sigmaE protein [Tropicibacter naphthalenivorans]SMC39673.1 hypothetical protein SAMN04488093_10179 [Tropicibacter naphthalenivorans]
MTQITDLPGGPEASAAEYALGLLSEEDRFGFERQLDGDPELEQEVIAWAGFLTTLTETVPPKTPPAALARRIERAAFGAPPPAIWRQVLPYALGAIAGAGIAWLVFSSGLLVGAGG